MRGARGIRLAGLLLMVWSVSSGAATRDALPLPWERSPDRDFSDGSLPESVPIIPAPGHVSQTSGSFTVTAETPVHASGGPAREAAQYFVELLARSGGPTLVIGDLPGAAGIRFEQSPGNLHSRSGDRSDAMAHGGYSLTVSPDAVVVAADSANGLFYGAVSLWQLLSAGSSRAAPIHVPAVEIRDEPRFRWRGLMLDSARHFQSPAFIKRFIDLMAMHKLNVLHWHLTDDQGWRLEIEQYPKLTGIGAWRVPAGPAAAADIDPATGQPRRYGGYYTQEQVRDIVAYAAARHVTIVPEIEMPGHASAAIAAYPELGVAGFAPRTVPADWGIYSNLFNVEESTFVFLENVLREVIALFPGEYVHIGGDEAVKDQWRASERIQVRMRELGIDDEAALQGYFVRRIGDFLKAQDRRLIGWDEILEGGLAPDATVMSWRGIDGAVAAAAAGHDAVLSPAPTLYLDHRPRDAAMPGRGKVISIEDVYRFDPAPAALGARQRRHAIGVQANVWTEHIRTEARVLQMTFPRAAALAEVAWSPAGRIDWASFAARLPAQLARYRAIGAGDDDAATAPVQRVPALAHARTSHELTLCSEKLVLSLEDDAPLEGDRATFLVDIMNPCWIYEDADLTQATGISASVGQVPFNFRIGDDVEQIVLPEPRTAAGELEVRVGGCDGDVVAALPLAPATGHFAVTELPTVGLTAPAGEHDLCLMFTRAAVDPIWVIDTVRLRHDR